MVRREGGVSEQLGLGLEGARGAERLKLSLRHPPAEARVDMCSSCGALVGTAAERRIKLGRCPACGGETWWRQEMPTVESPVGPFGPGEEEV